MFTNYQSKLLFRYWLMKYLRSATVERSCDSDKVSVFYMSDDYSGNTVQVPEVQLFPVAVAGLPQVVAQV